MTNKLGPLLTVVFIAAPIQSHAQAKIESDPKFEVVLGAFDHGTRKPFRGPPPNIAAVYEGEEERGTADIQLAWRSRPLTVALKPRLTAKLQINTGGRTSLASAGAEWRQNILGDRVYGQVGMGLALHNGYLNPVDPFEPGITAAEGQRRYKIYSQRTAFGSPVLFNPNLSLGLRLDSRWAIELAYEHYSHRQIFASQNPGINMVGLRLVHGFAK